MAFSRQFKALLRIAGFFAGTWAAVGAASGLIAGSASVAAKRVRPSDPDSAPRLPAT